MRSVKIAVLLLIVLSAVIPLLIVNNASAVGAPTVTLSLDQAELDVDVAPQDDGKVVFTGTVHVTMPVETTVQKVMVELIAESGAWACLVEPASMTFDREITDANFTVTVTVPLGTSGAVYQEMSVSGTARNTPGAVQSNVFPVTGYIDVNQFYGLKPSSGASDADIKPGKEHSFALNITNTGNDQDTVKVMIMPECQTEMENAGFEITMSQTEVEINKGQYAKVYIIVKVPKKPDEFRAYCLDMMVYSYQESVTQGEYTTYTHSFIVNVVDDGGEDEDSPAFGAALVIPGLLALAGASGVLVKRKRR